MISQPRFSLLMPAYNAQATIARAIASVQAQTCPDFELIITDDGSHDNTATIIRESVHHDRRIRLVSQSNAGCGAARDSAARQARGTYLVRFDADDELLPNYLEEMNALVHRRPGYDIYCCNGWHIDEHGKRRPARPGAFYEHERDITLEDMFAANRIFTIALYTRELYRRIGGIDHRVYCEDLEFWLRAFTQGQASCRYLPARLANYYVTATQMTADVAGVHASRIAIYEQLLAVATLTPWQVTLARQAIERTRHDDIIFARRQKLLNAVERLFGGRARNAASVLLHGVGVVLRPAAVAWLRLGKGRGDSGTNDRN